MEAQYQSPVVYHNIMWLRTHLLCSYFTLVLPSLEMTLILFLFPPDKLLNKESQEITQIEEVWESPCVCVVHWASLSGTIEGYLKW